MQCMQDVCHISFFFLLWCVKNTYLLLSRSSLRNLPFTEYIYGQRFSPLVQVNVRPVAILRRIRDCFVLIRFLRFVGIFAEHDSAGPLHGQFRLPHRTELGIRVVMDPHLAANYSERLGRARTRVYVTCCTVSTCCALQLFRLFVLGAADRPYAVLTCAVRVWISLDCPGYFRGVITTHFSANVSLINQKKNLRIVQLENALNHFIALNGSHSKTPNVTVRIIINFLYTGCVRRG